MSFNLQEVFSSLPSFVGSGYILVAIIAVVCWGLIKKLFRLCWIGFCCFAIWLWFQEPAVNALLTIKDWIQ